MGKPWSAAIGEFLRNVGMWPPAAEAGLTRETVLMQWWLPRVGGLMALLTALFFGVYINQSTSPLVKCLELLVVSLALCGLGYYTERHFKTFGSVLLVTGMIMLYLTSVAAYVLPATKVISNPLTGSAIQAMVLIGICVVGMWRRSTAIVLMTYHFGYFLAIFMAWEGLREGALIAGGLLFMGGWAMIRRELFRHLPWVVIPGTFLTVLAFPLLVQFRGTLFPGDVPVQVYLNVALAGIVLQYFLGELGTGLRARLLLSLGTSLTIFSVFLFYREIYPQQLQWAVLIIGCNMLAGSLAGWFRRGSGYLMQLLFLKATFLIGTWAILHFAGDLRWMVLALETLMVAVAARRARVLAMELAVWAVALSSLFYFLPSLAHHDTTVFSFLWWMVAAYPALLILAFAHLLDGFPKWEFSLQDIAPRTLYGVLPVLSCAIWYSFFKHTANRPFDMPLPFLVAVYGFAGMVILPVFSRWLLMETAALGYVAACAIYCSAPFSVWILIGIVIAGISGLLWLTRHDNPASCLGENAIYVLARVPVFLWLLQVLDGWPGKAVAMQIAAMLVLFSGLIKRLRDSSAWFFLPMLVFLVSEQPDPQAGLWSTAGLACGLAVLALPVLLSPVEENLGWARRAGLWSYIGTVLLWAYALRFGDREAPWLTGQLAFSVVAYLLLLGSWKWKVPGYFTGAILFVAIVALRHFTSVMGEVGAYPPWKSEALYSATMLYAFPLLWFFLKPQPFPFPKADLQRQFGMLCSGIGAMLIFFNSLLTFHYAELHLMNWYTPILAITAFVMILLGLFRADVMYRYLGLLALLIPLVRLFVVDVKDVLHRIIAFAAAAIVLTLLGYLYHRLAERLKFNNQ